MAGPARPAGTPRVLAAIIDGPLTRDREAAAFAAHGWREGREANGPAALGAVGAGLRFEGVVRRSEPNAEVLALEYETYDPMAERSLFALSREVAQQHGLIALAALHSRGRVAVGEVSFVLLIESVHRAEAIRAMADFIDRLKQDVPIWKRPVWADTPK